MATCGSVTEFAYLLVPAYSLGCKAGDFAVCGVDGGGRRNRGNRVILDGGRLVVEKNFIGDFNTNCWVVRGLGFYNLEVRC